MMLEPYCLPGLSLPLPPTQLRPAPAQTVARHYQLVALLLGGAGGQRRPVLGSRWHLPIYEQLQHDSNAALHQSRLTKPFVLRAALGESIATQITNLLPHTPLSLALVDDDYAILENGVTTIQPGETCTCTWRCRHVGIYPIYNGASPDPVERRNLLGVLIVEPQ
jgi:hypothetical protein